MNLTGKTRHEWVLEERRLKSRLKLLEDELENCDAATGF